MVDLSLSTRAASKFFSFQRFFETNFELLKSRERVGKVFEIESVKFDLPRTVLESFNNALLIVTFCPTFYPRCPFLTLSFSFRSIIVASIVTEASIQYRSNEHGGGEE